MNTSSPVCMNTQYFQKCPYVKRAPFTKMYFFSWTPCTYSVFNCIAHFTPCFTLSLSILILMNFNRRQWAITWILFVCFLCRLKTQAITVVTPTYYHNNIPTQLYNMYLQLPDQLYCSNIASVNVAGVCDVFQPNISEVTQTFLLPHLDSLLQCCISLIFYYFCLTNLELRSTRITNYRNWNQWR